MPFHGGNRGSNPLGDANQISGLRGMATMGVPGVCRLATARDRRAGVAALRIDPG